jgi:hypothetical protein
LSNDLFYGSTPVAQIQLLLTPSEAPIPYGIAMLALLFFALFFVFLALIVKIMTRGPSQVRRRIEEPSETDVGERRDYEKAFNPVEETKTGENDSETER